MQCPEYCPDWDFWDKKGAELKLNLISQLQMWLDAIDKNPFTL